MEKDFCSDAYVDHFPQINKHAVCIDIVEGSEVVHQMVCLTLGEHAAKETADMLNRWKNQMRVVA